SGENERPRRPARAGRRRFQIARYVVVQYAAWSPRDSPGRARALFLPTVPMAAGNGRVYPEDDMTESAGYVPPKVWSWTKPNGGTFAGTNRPIAGPTHEKELP